MDDASEPKKLSAIEFAKEKLSLNPEASYAEIKAQARFEGIPLFPVVYGRAKALLGLVPTAPYGSKSKARREAAEAKLAAPAPVAAAPEAAAAPRGGNGHGASRTARAKTRAAEATSGFEAMIDDLKNAVQERDRYKAVLEKLVGIIQEELDR